MGENVKHDESTAASIAAGLSTTMVYALARAIFTGREGSGVVLGRPGTLTALSRRGLLDDSGRWTALGREVAIELLGRDVASLDDLHEQAIAEDAERFPPAVATSLTRSDGVKFSVGDRVRYLDHPEVWTVTAIGNAGGYDAYLSVKRPTGGLGETLSAFPAIRAVHVKPLPPRVDIADLEATIVHDAMPAHLVGDVDGNHYVKVAPQADDPLTLVDRLAAILRQSLAPAPGDHDIALTRDSEMPELLAAEDDIVNRVIARAKYDALREVLVLLDVAAVANDPAPPWDLAAVRGIVAEAARAVGTRNPVQ